MKLLNHQNYARIQLGIEKICEKNSFHETTVFTSHSEQVFILENLKLKLKRKTKFFPNDYSIK